MASLEALVKDFTSAADEDRKAIYMRIEEEVGNLKGASAR